MDPGSVIPLQGRFFKNSREYRGLVEHRNGHFLWY
jgi:hypothetical protein